MSEHRTTVRDIAGLIRRPHEELSTVVERIRAWTDLGLIKPMGRKSPGTGRRRRYGAGAAVDALVLTALVDAGLAAIRVGYFQGIDGQTVLQLGRLGAASVFDPSRANQKIYLVIAGSPAASIHTTYVAYASGQERILLPPDADWSVVLYLNKIFQPLRGVVTATLNEERGFVEVTLIEDSGAPKYHLVCREADWQLHQGPEDR